MKLTRVVMLGPVVASVAALNRAFPADKAPSLTKKPTRPRGLTPAIPWFVTASLIMSVDRSAGVIDAGLLHIAAWASTLLTGLAMAALGLMVDLRVVLRTGSRVSTTAVLSILVIGSLGCALIWTMHLARRSI